MAQYVSGTAHASGKRVPRHECPHCSFVSDRDDILLYRVNDELREMVDIHPQPIGCFTMPDWEGHSMFYLFRCAECHNVAIDYGHGYTNGPFHYLTCSHCRGRLVLDKPEHRYVYEQEGIECPIAEEPRMAWETAILIGGGIVIAILGMFLLW